MALHARILLFYCFYVNTVVFPEMDGTYHCIHNEALIVVIEIGEAKCSTNVVFFMKSYQVSGDWINQ